LTRGDTGMIQYISPIYGFIPLMMIAAAFALPLFSFFIKRIKFFSVFTIAVTLIAFILSAIIFVNVYREGKPILYPFGGWPPPIGIAYEIDLFNSLFALFVAFIALLIVIYDNWYSTSDSRIHYTYYVLLLGLLAGVFGCIYTGDIFNLFVMVEVLSLSTYSLISFYRSNKYSLEAGLKYTLLGAVALSLYFVATIVYYAAYGTLNMADLAYMARNKASLTPFSSIFGNIVAATAVALVFTLWPFTFKSALFPNHFWLPDVYSSVSPVIAACFAGFTEATAIYIIARFLYTIFGLGIIPELAKLRTVVLGALLVLGILAALVGAFMMAIQRDARRLLAYSTVNHIGFIYIALSIGLFTNSIDVLRIGLMAMLLHIINHSIGKATLFLSIGSIMRGNNLNSSDLNALYGLGKTAPIAGTAIVIGALHLIGLPPFAGFFSKYYIYQVYLSVGQPIIAWLVVLVTAISLMGYAKLLLITFGTKPGYEKRFREALQSKAVLVTLMAMTIAISIALYIDFYSVLIKASESLVNYNSYIATFRDFVSSYLNLLRGS
jgi:multicomponent Na+:H+ antiporter subunit D